MPDIKVYSGDFKSDKAVFGIAAARFNGFIVQHLIDGAIDALKRHGVVEDHIELAYVPGALELPVTVQAMAHRKRYDAIIALGVVIRGATPHFDYVAAESAKGLAGLALQTGLPVINGVLTTDNIEQAIERAGTKSGNKGWDAGLTALEMVSLMRQLND
ncbi:6,7-dimethyl-8-ribityllumazine synthase [Acidihalobacter prosperus]